MVPAIASSCSSMIHKLRNEIIITSEIDMWPYLQDLVGDIISRTAFGSSQEEGRRIFQLQRDRVKLSLEIFQLTMIPGWRLKSINDLAQFLPLCSSIQLSRMVFVCFHRYLPTKTNRKVKAMTNELRSLLRGIIDKRQKAMERGEAVRNDFLGVLIESNSKFSEENGSKNAGMSIDDVIDECNVFYFGGSNSSASLMVWTMVMLCKHPEWQTRAREEVNRVLGDADPSFEILSQLKTVRYVL